MSFVDAQGNAHARRWTNRQSGLSAVRDETREVLVVVEAMHAGGAGDVARVLDAIAQGLREAWGTEPRTATLSGDQPAFAFP